MYAYHARQLEQSSAANKTNALDELKEKLKAKLPSKDEFVVNFMELHYSSTYTKEKGLIKYILTKYDAFYSKKNKSGVSKNYDLMTLEHIHAEKNKSIIVEDDFVGLLGNLILMDESLNSSIGNKPFNIKKPIYTNSDVYIDDKISTKTSWTENDILDRTEFIGEKLYNEVFKF